MPNGTFKTNSVVHTGQLFVEDDVNLAVDGVYPYSTNPLFHDTTKHGRTRNWRDSLQIFDHAHENGHNPVFEIQKLNGVLEQGCVRLLHPFQLTPGAFFICLLVCSARALFSLIGYATV